MRSNEVLAGRDPRLSRMVWMVLLLGEGCPMEESRSEILREGRRRQKCVDRNCRPLLQPALIHLGGAEDDAGGVEVPVSVHARGDAVDGGCCSRREGAEGGRSDDGKRQKAKGEAAVGRFLLRRRGKSGSWRVRLGKERADAKAAAQDTAKRSVYAHFCSTPSPQPCIHTPQMLQVRERAFSSSSSRPIDAERSTGRPETVKKPLQSRAESSANND